MKFINKILLTCLIITIPFAKALSQSDTFIKINGTVIGDDHMPVKGAIINGPDSRVKPITTDENGNFSLDVKKNGLIAISGDGLLTKYVEATEHTEIITVQTDKSYEKVQTAFRSVNKRDLLGGISSLNVSDLLQKNHFTYSLADMEAFIPGFNGNSNWGMGNYLFMIDGVPREVGNVVPTEIDQIVFLKGANAVALYGSRAARGVVNIITKRGVAGKNRFDLRVNSGLHTPKELPRYLGSAEYMTLYNEARRNDGLSNLYSEMDIYNHASGINKYRYPNVDFYSSEYLKSSFGRFLAEMKE